MWKATFNAELFFASKNICLSVLIIFYMYLYQRSFTYHGLLTLDDIRHIKFTIKGTLLKFVVLPVQHTHDDISTVYWTREKLWS